MDYPPFTEDLFLTAMLVCGPSPYPQHCAVPTGLGVSWLDWSQRLTLWYVKTRPHKYADVRADVFLYDFEHWQMEQARKSRAKEAKRGIT